MAGRTYARLFRFVKVWHKIRQAIKQLSSWLFDAHPVDLFFHMRIQRGRRFPDPVAKLCGLIHETLIFFQGAMGIPFAADCL